MSHSTITLRRSKRSMITPPTVPSRKPGSTRVVITRLTAAPELSETPRRDGEDGDEADPVARGSRRPAPIQSRKNALAAEDPPRRLAASAAPTASDGMNGASRSNRLLVGHPRLRTRSRRFRRGTGGRGRAFLAVAFLAAALLGRASSSWTSAARPSCVAFFAARLAGAFFVAGATRSPFAQQLDRLLERDRLGVGAARHRGVDGAVGDVGPEAAVEHPDRRARLRVRAELGERRLRRARPRRCFGWAKIAFASPASPRRAASSEPEAAAVGALLEVGTVATVLRGDLLAVVVDPDHAWQREQRQRLLERDRRRIHRREQRRPLAASPWSPAPARPAARTDRSDR